MKKAILLILLLAVAIAGFAQKQGFTSPNASTLGFFGRYPQSSFTGVPAINIPLYNFSYEGLQLPITLTYNNNAVKPDVPPGWAGLGWNLSVGGTITRTVNGYPDDASWHFERDFVFLGRHENVGYYYSHGYMSGSGWANTSSIENGIGDMYTYTYDHTRIDYIHTVNDYAPDEFSFSVADLSGAFYMDETGGWKVKCNVKMKVEVTMGSEAVGGSPNYDFGTGGSSYPNRTFYTEIKLTDNRGIKYIFNTKEYAMFGQEDSYWQYLYAPYFEYVKSWHISSIVFPNGKTIAYTYDPGQIITTHEVTGRNWDFPFSEVHTQLSRPSYLSSISCSEQTIDFFRSETSGQPARLDSIRVREGTYYKQVNKFVFKHSNTPRHRLRLDSLYQKTTRNEVFGKYKMQYNSDTLRYDQAYGFTYVNKDEWGYNTYIPLNDSSSTKFYNSKRADTAHCRADLLEKLIYPTGGYTRYTWEPNTYSKTVPHNRANAPTDHGANRNTSGTRIRQIANYDSDHTLLGKKRYSYIRNYSSTNTAQLSSGILADQPQLWFWNANNLSYGSNFPFTRMNSGPHVTYSEVTEIDANNGYKKTVYSNFDTGVSGEYRDAAADNDAVNVSGVLNPQYTSNGHERGFPLYETAYNSSDVAVQSRKTEYERLNKSIEYAKAYVGKVNLDGDPDLNDWEGSAIKFYTNPYVVKTVTDTLFDENGSNPVVTSTSYGYNAVYRQVEGQTTVDSKGDTRFTHLKYPYDFTGTTVYDEMIARNMIAPLVEQNDYAYNPGGVYPINVKQINYGLWNSPANLALPVTVKNKRGSSSTFETETEYFRYNNDGRLLSFSEKGAPTINYLYGYRGFYPIAEIRNVDYSTIETAIGSSAINTYSSGTFYANQAIRSFLAPVVSAAPLARISCYTYAPTVGMTTASDTRGQFTSYQYDLSNRLQSVWDNRGNLVRRYCYNVAGQPQGCPMIGTGAVSATSATFYARLELVNPVIDNPASNWDYRYADLYLRFYTDASCTTPYTTQNNINARYQVHRNWYDVYDPVGDSSDYDVDIAVPMGVNGVMIAYVPTSGYEEFGSDPILGTLWYQEYYTYTLLSTGSPAQPFANYTAQTTYVAP